MNRRIARLLFFSAALPAMAASTIQQYHSQDFSFRAAVQGNPFDVEFGGDFIGPQGVRLCVPVSGTRVARFFGDVGGQGGGLTCTGQGPSFSA